MTAAGKDAAALRLLWIAPPGGWPAWVAAARLQLQREGRIACTALAAADAPDAPGALPEAGAADGSAMRSPVAAAGDRALPAVALCLDPVSAPQVAAGVPCWLLTDDEGRALATRWPLLGDITGGQGMALRLWQREEGTPARWQPLRRLHVGASPRYGHGRRGLADAVARLLRQAVVDRLLAVPPPSRAGGAGRAAEAGGAVQPLPGPAAAPPWPHTLARLARGAAAAWRARQRARWLSESWRIGVVEAPLAHLLTGDTAPVRWLPMPARLGYWADPMAHGPRSGELVCEFYDEIAGRGHIERLRLDGRDRVRSFERVPVDGGTHASFPLVVELEGRLLGLAETAARRQSVLHEIDADGRWHPIVTLLHGVAAADPALFRWQGRYWLAYTDIDLGETDNLCLQHALSLEGPWVPHANNPVKTDVRGARMAGGWFVHGGVLYRPGQDCLATYGAGVVLHRVLQCTPTTFEEVPAVRLDPDRHGPCPDGLHTLGAWGMRTLIDGKRHVFNLQVLWHKLRRRHERHRHAAAMGARRRRGTATTATRPQEGSG